MAKTKISEFSSTPANNTDIDSINIAEGCAPSGINDAIRELMAQLKDWQSGTSNDPMVIGSSGSLTLNQGTANGVAYLNGSKVVTSGSALTFDGAILGVNGVSVGRGAGAVSTNTAVGASALAANTSGSVNAAFGSNSLSSNTSGGGNAAFGPASLQNNTTGGSNTALGYLALTSNSTGSFNIAVGQQALNSNTTASNNTAVGYQAGYSNQTGVSTTFIGYQAGYSNTTNHNAFVGAYVGRATTTGTRNIAMGGDDGTVNPTFYVNTTGSNNVALGIAALGSNTTASNNTAVGYQAGYSNATGTRNVFVGGGAGYSATTPDGDTHIGFSAGNSQTTGFANTFVGGRGSSSANTGAGNNVTTGTYNTFIGGSAGGSVTTGSKNTILGNYNGNQGGLDIRTLNNFVVLSDGDGNIRGMFDNSARFLVGKVAAGSTAGWALNSDGKGDATFTQVGTNEIFVWNNLSTAGTAIVDFRTAGTSKGRINWDNSNTSYNTTSDYRLKENVQPMVGALAKVATLKPCTYTWKDSGEFGQGFIAHELGEVVPECVTGEKDAVDENGAIKPQGIDTSFLVATLTAAIQELKAEFDAYKASHP